MDLAGAALIFATNLTDSTWNKNWGPYDHQTMAHVVDGIVRTTDDLHEVETLIRIARYESGGWRSDVVSCNVKGDHGLAYGAFQVHPLTDQDAIDLCSKDTAEQAAVALRYVDASVEACKKFGLKDSNLLTVYTHGHCHVAKDNIAALHWGDGKELQAIMDVDLDEDDDDSIDAADTCEDRCEEVCEDRCPR